jgi:tetratricopeptide (TPR) repeat protein
MLPSQHKVTPGHRREERGAGRPIACFALCALCFLAAGLPGLAQQKTRDTKETIGWVPREILERPVTLRQGIGTVHEKVTTSSPQAQTFYDQGLAYLNSYVWIEAARSFNQALRLDPSLAMAWLGLSDAYIGLQDIPAARATFEKAQSLAGKVSELERARITIRASQLDYLEDSGDIQKYFAYRQAISDAMAANSNDPWLWIVRGFADEGMPLAHGQAGRADTIAFYEMALGLSPDNFAAHLYLAHTFENLGRTKEALEQSEIYARLAPAVPHAHHMRGHNLRRAGRTEEAIQAFLKAQELENAYYRAENIPAQFDWHRAHNLELLAMSYQALGQMKAAEAAFREAFALPAYTDFAEFNRRAWPEFLLDRGRAQEALAASQDFVNSGWALGRFTGHTLAGRALLAMNRIEDAKSELALAEREMEQIPASIIGALPNTGALRAEILLREKKLDEGNALMKQIEDKIDAVVGPDAWCEALFQFESIARLSREVGDWDLAESTARRMIQHDPSYAGGYYALGLVAEHQGDAATARQEFATAEKLWSKADPDLQRPHTQNP